MARSPESVASWREDLAVFERELPRTHKNLFHSMTQEEFATAIARLVARVPELDDDAIVVELARIVADLEMTEAVDARDPSRSTPLYLREFEPGLLRNAKKNFWYEYLPESIRCSRRSFRGRHSARG